MKYLVGGFGAAVLAMVVAPLVVAMIVVTTVLPAEAHCRDKPEGCTKEQNQSQAWSDGTDCGFDGVSNPRSCRDALAAAAKIANTQACRNVVRGGTWNNRCGEFVARLYGYYASGEATALVHYATLKSRGLIHASADNIPAGALVFFTTGQSAGHVAVYAGGGKAYSNDYMRSGCIDLTPMSVMAGANNFLGWAPPVFPNAAPL